MSMRIAFFQSDLYAQIKEMIKSLGLVFGDIGTSPIYTISIIFLTTPITKLTILGILSLIVWTLTLLVFVKYAMLAMSLGKKGEGGTIVLKELLVPLLSSSRQVAFVSFLSYIGISLLFGDGVLTPAISILSAIEGIQLIPALKDISQSHLMIIACFIAVCLFVFQKRGTDKVSAAFGPLMLIWFLVLATSGIVALVQAPFVLYALNPYYAVKFLIDHGFSSFFILSGVILCSTGGEALYADMGHLGRLPIQRAGIFVYVALILTYLGQGAYLFNHTSARHVFYEMIYYQAPHLYSLFVCLSVIATIVASQAMISGIFSAVYQGITTKVLPTFKIDYTSSKFRSQIYVSAVNWFIFVAVIGIILHFKETHKIAAAYGFAVTGTMTTTGIMMSWIFFLRRNYLKASVSLILTCITFTYFASNSIKIPHGAYLSLILALIPLSIILIYSKGREQMAKNLRPMPLEKFLEKYNLICQKVPQIEGTALYFVRQVTPIAPYISQTIFKNNILYQDNIIISIITRDNPFGVIGFFQGDLAPGLRIFEIHMGYMEIVDIEKILHNAGINPKVIFYGFEEVVTKNPLWKMFSVIKKMTPSTVKFYNLPAYKLHGVVTVVEM